MWTKVRVTLAALLSCVPLIMPGDTRAQSSEAGAGARLPATNSSNVELPQPETPKDSNVVGPRENLTNGRSVSPGERGWLQAEYLQWWIRRGGAPPLVTTSPPGTAPEVAGVLGQDTTSTLFGGSNVGRNVFSGARFSA